MKKFIVLLTLIFILVGCSAAGLKNQVKNTGDSYNEKSSGPYRTESLTIRYYDTEEEKNVNRKIRN